MERITKQTLRERYRSLNTAELITLGKAGQLTATARPLLLEELAARGITDIDAPELPAAAEISATSRDRLRRAAAAFILVIFIGLALGMLFK